MATNGATDPLVYDGFQFWQVRANHGYRYLGGFTIICRRLIPDSTETHLAEDKELRMIQKIIRAVLRQTLKPDFLEREERRNSDGTFRLLVLPRYESEKRYRETKFVVQNRDNILSPKPRSRISPIVLDELDKELSKNIAVEHHARDTGPLLTRQKIQEQIRRGLHG